MGRPSLETKRKQELIDATISAIAMHGLADTTVVRIGSHAGVSPSIVHHYFTGKDELCEAAMRSLLRKLKRAVLERLRKTSDPRERIAAIIEGNFAPEQFTMEGVRAWLAFWDRVPQAPAIARLQKLNSARTRSNLLHDFKKILPEAEAHDAASNLTALLDGLWLRCALSSDGFSPEEARRLAMTYLSAHTVGTHTM